MSKSQRLDALRRAVLVEGGTWTVERARNAILPHITSETLSPGHVRSDLNDLRGEGLLVRQGGSPVTWTLSPEAQDQSPVVALAQRIQDGLDETGKLNEADVVRLVPAILNRGH